MATMMSKARALAAEENGPHWRALTEYRIAPSEETAVAVFAAVLAMAEKMAKRGVSADA